MKTATELYLAFLADAGFLNDPDASAWAAANEPAFMRLIEAAAAAEERARRTIPMILFCPRCGVQHVDAPSEGWDNPPHKSHLCANCKHIWRPSSWPTTGVFEIDSHGSRDDPALRGHSRSLASVSEERKRCIAKVRAYPGARPHPPWKDHAVKHIVEAIEDASELG